MKLSNSFYVGINITISLLSFFRSYIFLKQMNLYELGLVGLFQTILLLITLCQIGILNGSYRAFVSSSDSDRQTINNFTFTFFFGLTLVSSLIGIIVAFTYDTVILPVLIGGIISGILSLGVNYLANCFLAEVRVSDVNKLNIVSNGLGFLSLILVIYDPILGLVSFIVQPLSFILFSFVLNPALIPNRLLFNRKILRYLLRLGFIPYLTALLAYLSQQIERWSIVSSLGIETFGKYYLALTYITLFALLPASINNLFFAKMVKAYSERNLDDFYKMFSKYKRLLLYYCIASILLTIFLAPEIVSYFFPQHIANLKYVYFVAPGLLAITIINPILVYFNAAIEFKALTKSYSGGVVVVAILVIAYYIGEIISLELIAVTDSIGNIVISILVFYYYRKSSKSKLIKKSTKSFI